DRNSYIDCSSEPDRYGDSDSYIDGDSYSYACADHPQRDRPQGTWVRYRGSLLERGDLSSVDIHRNGVIVTVPHNPPYTDNTGQKGPATFTYQVCNAGTETCSNNVTVNF